MSLTTEVLLTLTETVETAANFVLKKDQSSLQKLGKLQGKVIALNFTGLDITLYLLPNNQGIQVMYLYHDKADTTLQGSPLAFMNMSIGDATNSFFSGEVRIKGDIETGQQFKRILDQLDLDWEEWLSGLTGDLVAHKAGNLLRNLDAWGKATLNTLQRDASEYLHEEAKLSPQLGEIDAFTQDIRLLRDQAARLEARLQRLQKSL